MNYIEKVRVDSKKIFDEETMRKTDSETVISPSGNFRLDITDLCGERFSLKRVEIYDLSNNEKIFDFLTSDDFFFFSWLETNNTEYLVCAEDIYGGQTVVDLTNKKMTGYATEDSGYIWTDFHLSPNGKILATIGCYWACPYVIKIFDFTNPLTLPLPELKQIELLDNDEVIIGWADNENLKMKGIRREKEREYFDNGAMRVKIISEEPVERVVNIN